MSILFQKHPISCIQEMGYGSAFPGRPSPALPNLHDGGVVFQKLLRLSGFREADMERVAVDFHNLAAAERLMVDCIPHSEGDTRGLLLPRLRVDVAVCPLRPARSRSPRPALPDALERPNTRPPPASVPLPAIPRRLPRFSQPVPEKPAEPSPEVWRSSAGISWMNRDTGFADV